MAAKFSQSTSGGPGWRRGGEIFAKYFCGAREEAWRRNFRKVLLGGQGGGVAAKFSQSTSGGGPAGGRDGEIFAKLPGMRVALISRRVGTPPRTPPCKCKSGHLAIQPDCVYDD